MNWLIRKTQMKSPALAAGLGAFLLGFHDAFADVDLQSGFDEASSKFRKYVKQGITIAALICTVVSLGIGGWKFMNRDPHAVWYLVGVVCGGIVFGVAQGIM